MRYLDNLALRFLRLFSAETAHDLAMFAMRRKLFAPGRYEMIQDVKRFVKDSDFDAPLPKLFGHEIPNPLGLAAGFDKNGYLPGVIQDYGFGYVEVGSVTFRGGPGNPKPRMFRIEDGNIMNRMGLNGEAASLVAERLRKAPQDKFAVNIAKTHSPEILGDKAIQDMVASYSQLKTLGLYTVLNVSCPNTAEGKTFENPSALKELLHEVTYYNNPGTQIAYLKFVAHRIFNDNTKSRPLLLKFSPTLIPNGNILALDQVLKVSLDFPIAGFVLCNTWPLVHPKYGKGGASGSFVYQKMLETVKFVRKACPDKVIIACGGITAPFQLVEAEKAGANFFQVYNGFVRGPYSGRRFAYDMLRQTYRLKATETVKEAQNIVFEALERSNALPKTN